MARTYNKPGSAKAAPEKTIQKVQTASAFRPEKTAAVKEADIEGEEAPVQAEKKTPAKTVNIFPDNLMPFLREYNRRPLCSKGKRKGRLPGLRTRP